MRSEVEIDPRRRRRPLRRLHHLAPHRRLRQAPGLHRHLPGPHPLAPHAGGAADEGPHGRRRRARGRARPRDRQPAGGDLRLGPDARRPRRRRPRAAQADRDPAQGEPPPRPHDQGVPALRPPARALERLLRHRPAARRELRAAPQQRGGLRPPPPGARPRSPLGPPVRRPRPGEPDLLEPGAQLPAGDARRRLAAGRHGGGYRGMPASGTVCR